MEPLKRPDSRPHDNEPHYIPFRDDSSNNNDSPNDEVHSDTPRGHSMQTVHPRTTSSSDKKFEDNNPQNHNFLPDDSQNVSSLLESNCSKLSHAGLYIDKNGLLSTKPNPQQEMKDAKARKRRTDFTKEDDKFLARWAAAALDQALDVESNRIYQDLEKVNPRHSAAVWKKRYMSHMCDLSSAGLKKEYNLQQDGAKYAETATGLQRRHLT